MPLHTITPPTDILSPINYANEVTGTWFGGFIILFIFFVTFTGLKLYNTEKAFLVSSVISFISTVLLVPTGIVNPIMILLMLPLVIAGIWINH